jgi:cobalt-zinc-cadmium efflux system membrane fusion protein
MALLAYVAHRPRHESAPAAAIQVDKTGVTLPEGAPQWDYVKLAVAAEGPALPPLPVPGRVGFDEKRTASIGAPLAGRVEQVPARLGDSVKPGDKLFSMRSRDFAELDKEAATAREAVAVKRRLRDRAKELLELNAIPEKEVLAAEAELKEAELALRAAQAKQRSLSVAAAGDNLFWVRAPSAGTIVSLDVFASQEVTPDRAEPLVRISDMDEVLVLADVPEIDAADLTVGSEATIRTRDGVERSGTIEQISSVMDPQRQTVGVRIRAANADHALKPNAFVEVTFQPQEGTRRVQVDEEAVVSDGSHSTLFVLEDSNRLEKREVQPGRRRSGTIEIRSGLQPGTRYVAKGALLLLNQVDLAD